MTPRPSAPTVSYPGTAVGPGHSDRRERPSASSTVLDAVTDLRRDVAATSFPLPIDGVEVAEARRRQLLDQLDDHLLPRLRELSAPALVVVAGSTGAGKSTLVNSLLGTEVSLAGVLRPTTRRPVLAHHPDDADLLADHPLLDIVDVVPHEVVPRGLALIDAPDLDSLEVTNRSTAHRLLEAADLWVFVTTAARYGDALPWDVLDRATERQTSMAMVLNRVPDDALVTVRGDLMTRLRERGMAAVPLFLVPDVGPHQGLLEPRAVAPILRWLTMIAGPDRARSVIARTQRGSLAALRPWVDDLAEAVQAQVDARTRLETVVDDAVRGPTERAVAAVHGGAVANGPVRGRWVGRSTGGGPLAGRWTSRRGQVARAAALAEVAEELIASATVALAAAREAGEHAVVEALHATDAVGAAGLLDRITAAVVDDAAVPGVAPADDAPATVTAVPTPAQSAGDWLLTAGQVVRELTDSTDRATARAASRLVKSAGSDGAATLVALAAAGLGAARVVLTGLIGGGVAHDLVARVTGALADRVAEQVRAGTASAHAALATQDLADDAASGLRLRLAVLKDVT